MDIEQEQPSAFVIAGVAHAAALRKRLADCPGTLVFSESESMEALRAIMGGAPKILALDSTVVKTARGALIVARLRENRAVDVRLLIEDASSVPVILKDPDIPLKAASQPLEESGTRAARRYPMTNIEVVIDGEPSRLVNLSITGAQVILPGRVQPRQNLRFILIHENDKGVETRVRALVAWSNVELGKTAVRYRAGLAFVDPPTEVLATFCQRYSVRA